jgi:Fe(3+) dicitrate transport protein
VTNGNGYFLLKDIPEGYYTLVISNMGYQTINRAINVKQQQKVVINGNMVESISSLNEVVVMTRGAGGLKEISGSVSYLSPKELQKFSYTDVNRVLRAVPGVNLQEEDGYGLRPNIGLRGSGVERSSRITLMEDGVLIAPAPYADPAAYYFPTIGRMQAVEVLKGSSQIKYGPYTTGGAINLVSTQIPDQLLGRINLIGGSYGGRSLHAFVGNSHNNVAYLAEAFQYSSDGFKELDGGGATGFDKKDYHAKVRVNTNPEAKIYQSLTLKLGQSSEVSDETYLGLTDEDFDLNPNRRYAASQYDQMNTDHSQVSVTHVARFSKSLSVSTVAYYTDFERNWYKLDKVKDSTGAKTGIADVLANPENHHDAYNILTGSTSTFSDALTMRANNRAYYAKGIQSLVQYSFTTNEFAHNIDFGIRFHTDEVDRFQWEDQYAMDNSVMKLTKAGTPGTESNRVVDANAFATYVQYKLKYKKLTVIPGIRYENMKFTQDDYGKKDPDRTGTSLVQTSNKVDVIIPGIGIDYQFNRYTSSFVGIHKGFAPPGPKPETKPEESTTYEAGVRYAKNAIAGQVIFFFNDYSNLLGTDLSAGGGNGTGDLFNSGESQTRGVEFQLSYDLLSCKNNASFSLPLSVSYTYTDGVFLTSFNSSYEDWGVVSEGDHFPYLAPNQLTVSLGLEYSKFGINLSGRYMDAMRTTPGQGDIPANEKTDSYFVLDASASYTLHKNISLFWSATNLMNDAYIVARRPAGVRPGMPQAFNIGIKANF